MAAPMTTKPETNTDETLWGTKEDEMRLLMQDEEELTPPSDDPLSSGRVIYDGPMGRIASSGFWKEDKEGAWYCVHPLPLWPVEIIEAAAPDGSKSVYVRVRFARIHGGVGEVKLPLGELGGFGRKDHPLVRAGWKPPTNKRAAAVEEMLTYCIKEHSERRVLPTREGYETAGWVSHDQHVRPGMDVYVGPAPGSTVTAGTKVVWQKTMTELMEDSGILAFCVAAALGSMFRGVVPLPHSTSHILNLTGAPSRGKTTILKAVSSLAGVPDKPSYVDGASTARGLENRLASSNHGWLLVDEMDQLLMKDADGGATTLMFISNGGGREKATQTGGTITGATWTVTVLSTGNKALLDLAASAKKGEALTTRIFELDILDGDLTTFTEVSALPSRLHALSQNHGWGYPAAVEAIRSRRGHWVETFYTYDEELRGNPRLSAIFSDQARLLAFFELAMLGADLAGEIISETAGAAAHEAISAAMARYEQEPENAIGQSLHRQHKLLLDLHEWLSLNAGRFLWKGYAHREPVRRYKDTAGQDYVDVSEEQRQTEQARHLASMAMGNARGALGQIHQVRLMDSETDFEGTLVLGAAALDELERSAGIDRAELTTALKTFGLLQTNEKDRDGYKLSTSLARQLGGGSRGLKMLLRKPDLAEQARSLASHAKRGAWRPAGLADSDDYEAQNGDLWHTQDQRALQAHGIAEQGRDSMDERLEIPGFEDVPSLDDAEHIARLFEGTP